MLGNCLCRGVLLIRKIRKKHYYNIAGADEGCLDIFFSAIISRLAPSLSGKRLDIA